MTTPYGPDNPGLPWPPPPANPTPGWPGEPTSAQPGPGQVPWPAPPPAPKRTGKIVAIVLGITVPVLAIVVVAGILVVPRILETTPNPSPSGTPDITAVPAVGSCFEGTFRPFGFNDRAESNKLVDCSAKHMFEAVSAGSIQTRPDGEHDPQAGDLYDSCSEDAEKFLGQPWITTYTWLVLSVPSEAAWNKGAHWYRCDLVLNDDVQYPDPVQTVGSLRDSAEPITCLLWTVVDGTAILDTRRGECTLVHNGELAGAVEAPTNVDRDDQDARAVQFARLCAPVVLDFLDRSSLPTSLSLWFYWSGRTREQGRLDQYVLCVISADDLSREFDASIKGLGSDPIPFA